MNLCAATRNPLCWVHVISCCVFVEETVKSGYLLINNKAAAY